MPSRLLGLLVLSCLGVLLTRADGPGDNLPDKVRPIPPEGVPVDARVREALAAQLDELGKAIAALPTQLKGKAALLELMPDVEVYHKAVKYALEMNQFHAPADLDRARKHLASGMDRARQLSEGKPAWTRATGLVVRGFRSRIDDSVQPYGLVVPPSFSADTAHRHRLDIWLHGRGETSSEVNFIDERQRSAGQFTSRDTFVLHPYGRYCNAFKFAGEIDVLEAMAHVRKHYRIDDDRVVMRGFSMGGAGCWQLAVRYPDRWCAAAPGAGFSETPDFLKVFQNEKLAPPSYERKLWRLHDCPDWCANLFNLPTVAYSGEKDQQKQAADMMEAALKKENIDLVHIIGAQAKHVYTPKARDEINERIDRLAQQGRPRVPARVRFTTYTLRYDRSYWVRVDGLASHWEKASVDAVIANQGLEIEVKTNGVTAVTLAFGPGDAPWLLRDRPLIILDNKRLTGGPVRSDRSWSASFVKTAEGWKLGTLPEEPRKRHLLQGPIDDAFMDRFIFVRPTGKPMHEKTGTWVKSEMERAIREWRRHFRGDAIVKDDVAINEADMNTANVVLWGDPSSNRLLAKMVDKLPLGWDDKSVSVGKDSFDASTHVALSIQPNPLAPNRYVVLNSGFTFREYDYLNNARQTPKLPDYAVIDVTTPPSKRWPGKVAAAGFFDERWRFPGQ